MLPVKLHSPSENFILYRQAVKHLATNTVVHYNKQPYHPNGDNNKPSYDISQVCCWVSEQPLKNGMQLCAIGKNDNIVLINEPVEEVYDQVSFDRDLFNIDHKKLLLISSDCFEGLKMSIEYLNEKGAEQKLIRNPLVEDGYVTADPLNSKFYILPLHNTSYDSQECFIYSIKTALAVHVPTPELVGDNEEEPDIEGGNDGMEVEPDDTWDRDSETLKEFLFVEANPALPHHLYIMAENTIRLFRLNGRYYDYLNNDGYHCIQYRTSESEYDDLRLEGRMQAYDRARKSLHQIKTMRSLFVDPDKISIFFTQYNILMELTGYASVWATVFNEGNDPGGFNDIMGITAPITPVTPVNNDISENTPVRTENILNIADVNKFIDVIVNELGLLSASFVNRYISVENVLDIKKLERNIADVISNNRKPNINRRGKSGNQRNYLLVTRGIRKNPPVINKKEAQVEVLLNGVLKEDKYFKRLVRVLCRKYSIAIPVKPKR